MSLSDFADKPTILKELLWCIGAPGLLAHFKNDKRIVLPSQKYFEEAATDFLKMTNEKPLNSFAVQPEPEGKQRLILGKRFEHLLRIYFEISPRFDLLFHGVQLFEGERTGGEIDFIVRDHQTNKTIHIETACKFYLSASNQTDHRSWFGINPGDTLALKAEKMRQQCLMTTRGSGKEWCIRNKLVVDERQAWLKGYLFHHYSAITHPKAPTDAGPKYPSGWWMRRTEAIDFFRKSGGLWAVLPKDSWLAPATFTDHNQVHNADQMAALMHAWPDYFVRSMMIALLTETENDKGLKEQNRGVVVPDRWPGI